jgi:hypothetical protein
MKKILFGLVFILAANLAYAEAHPMRSMWLTWLQTEEGQLYDAALIGIIRDLCDTVDTLEKKVNRLEAER